MSSGERLLIEPQERWGFGSGPAEVSTHPVYASTSPVSLGHHAKNLQIVVERDEVGGKTGSDRTEPVGHAQQPRAGTVEAAGRDRIILGARPEAFGIVSSGTRPKLAVELVEELGADAYVYGTLVGDVPGVDKPFVVPASNGATARIWEILQLELRADTYHVFDVDTVARLAG